MEITLILICALFGLICFKMAEKRGRSKWVGLILGLLVGIFAVIGYAIVGETEEIKTARIKKILDEKKIINEERSLKLLNNNKNMEQIKCPNCGSFKTISISKKTHILASGIVFILISSILSLFIIGIIIGIPMIIIGISLTIASSVMKDTGEMICKNCNFKFKEAEKVQSKNLDNQKQNSAESPKSRLTAFWKGWF